MVDSSFVPDDHNLPSDWSVKMEGGREKSDLLRLKVIISPQRFFIHRRCFIILLVFII